MKKLILAGLLALTATAGAYAQSVYNGKVTDKNGTPVPGAKVESADGSYTTVTDMNGQFSLPTGSAVKKLTFVYPGYSKKISKAGNDMLVKMTPDTWWSWQPEKYQWFVGLSATTPVGTFKAFRQPADIAWGIRFGRVKNWGWYVAAGISPDRTGDILSGMHEGVYFDNAPNKFSTLYFTAGAIRRLWSPIYLYLGFGYRDNKGYYKSIDGEKYLNHKSNLFCVEAGLMVRYKMVFIQGGIMAGGYKNTDTNLPSYKSFAGDGGITLGVGYIF